MPHENTIMKEALEKVRARQKLVGRILGKRGLPFKLISDGSGISYSTIVSYFSQKKDAQLAAIPVAALTLLFGVIPDDILSHLTEPEGRCFHGTTTAERAAEARLTAIIEEASRALAEMRGDAVGQDELFEAGA